MEMKEITKETFWKHVRNETLNDRYSVLHNAYKKWVLCKYYHVILKPEEVRGLVVAYNPTIIEPFHDIYGLDKNSFNMIRTLEKMSMLIKPKISRFFEYGYYRSIKGFYNQALENKLAVRPTLRTLVERSEAIGNYFIEDGNHRLLAKVLAQGFTFDCDAYLADPIDPRSVVTSLYKSNAISRSDALLEKRFGDIPH